MNWASDMLIRQRHRRGFAWLELLLVLAVLALLLQFFPSFFPHLVATLDVRMWSRGVWFGINMAVLLVLVAARFGPELWQNLKNNSWQQRNSRMVRKPVVLASSQRIDPRVGVQREERLRAEQRRKLAIRLIVIALTLSAVAYAGAMWRDALQSSVASIEPLFKNHQGPQRESVGTIGGYFRVRADEDVEVTHLGFFDSGEDGLQLSHRVGVFEARRDDPTDCTLVAEAQVPYGKGSYLEGGYRWVRLDKPVILKAGRLYVLGAETVWRSGDLIPRCVTEDGRGVRPEWNDKFVGKQTDATRRAVWTPATRRAVWTRGEWPSIPDQVDTSDEAGTICGAPNIGFSLANRVAQPQ